MAEALPECQRVVLQHWGQQVSDFLRMRAPAEDVQRISAATASALHATMQGVQRARHT